MKKFQLKIDTESINIENEIHANNFASKIRSLAQHCVDYINGNQDDTNCTSNKFNRDFHDNETYPTNEVLFSPVIYQSNVEAYCLIQESEYPSIRGS